MLLANVDPATFWAHRSWRDFSDRSGQPNRIAILPVCGFADHGLGLPLDAEEMVATDLLRRASLQLGGTCEALVLPVLRFALAPAPCTFLGLDFDTAHETVIGLARCIQAAGFRKLVFLNASPWNEEMIDATSRDVRVELALQTFVINLSGLGLSLDPADEADRARFRAAAEAVTGRPAAPSVRPAAVRDEDLRPPCWMQPPPLATRTDLDGGAILAEAASRLSGLLLEVEARGPLGSRSSGTLKSLPAAGAVPPAQVFPRIYRHRYLPSLTRDELETLPAKERALVVLPTGAIEQHGHHLPVGVDAILNQAWLERMLPQLPDDLPVWVAPPLTFTKSNEHNGFPGTLFTSASLLRRHLIALVTQLHGLGFRRFVIFNTHGGNSAVNVTVCRELQHTLGVRIGMLPGGFKWPVDAQELAYGFHAGEIETSLMLEAAPDTVRMERAVREFPARIEDPGELRPENAPAIFSWISSDISTSGVMGDATLATAAKGHEWMQAAAAHMAATLRRIAERP